MDSHPEPTVDGLAIFDGDRVPAEQPGRVEQLIERDASRPRGLDDNLIWADGPGVLTVAERIVVRGPGAGRWKDQARMVTGRARCRGFCVPPSAAAGTADDYA